MENEAKCRNCRFYKEGMCKVDIWKEAKYYPAHPMQPNDHCYLYEEAPDALPE